MSTRLLAAIISVLACLALSLADAAGAGAQAGPLAFASCRSDQVFVTVPGLQCATLTVPFDRADPSEGSIALALQRVPASAPRQGVIVLARRVSPGAGCAAGTLRVGETVLALSGHLTVRGRLDGTLTLHGSLLSGRLDGARVRARLAALA